MYYIRNNNREYTTTFCLLDCKQAKYVSTMRLSVSVYDSNEK